MAAIKLEHKVPWPELHVTFTTVLCHQGSVSPHMGSQIPNHIKGYVIEFLILDSKTQRVNRKKEGTRVSSKRESQ